ncbi:MAG: mechanosensitive ion channel domain-containing protein [Rhodothermales bacterium]
MIQNLLTESDVYLRVLAVLGGALGAGLLVHWAVFRVLQRIASSRPGALPLDDLIVQHTRAPFRLLAPLVALYLAHPLVPLEMSADVRVGVSNTLYVFMVVSLAWLFIRLTLVMQQAISRRFDVGVADNLEARKVHTQAVIIRRLLVFGIIILGLSAVLLRFEGFRRLGTGLLASAGIVGIIVGFAAQRTLGNLLAGFQIAITQPIRVDDVVVVEGEWGRIEEITLTYVVVRVWDQRRLVLPISYFLERPFQNWTRTTAEILGTVFLHVDYTVPFDAVRDELHRLLQESPHWDGNVWRLHVTDSTDRTVELRALMSAVDSGTAWELRCEIREKLISFIQREYPQALPVVRASMKGEQPASGGRPPAEPSHDDPPSDKENVRHA